jgi:hypothetical protein
MKPPEPKRPSGSGLSLSIGLLIVGALIGFGLRHWIASPRPATADDPAQARLAVRQSAAPALAPAEGVGARPSRPACGTTLTLSEEQFSMILADPGRFRLRLEHLLMKHPRPHPMVLRHAKLFGWDGTVITQVDEALVGLGSRWAAMEVAKAETSYPEPGWVVVTFGAMAADMERLLGDFGTELASIVGHRDAARFAAVAVPSAILAERAPDLIETAVVTSNPAWGFYQVQILRLRDGRDVFSTRYTRQRGNDLDSQHASPAIDWDRIRRDLETHLPADE